MDIEILMPKATKNLILNPSFENSIAGWVATPEGDGQIARWEANRRVGYPDGADGVLDPGNQLSITKQAALSGAYGLECATNGNGDAGYLELSGPTAEKAIFAGFLLDLNNYSMNANDIHNILVAPGEINVRLKESGGSIFLEGFYQDDAGSLPFGDYPIPFPGISSIDFQVVAADNPGDNDGIIRVWIDGALFFEDLNVDNDTKAVDELRFGLNTAPNVNNTGSFYMDNVYWYRANGNFVVAEPTLERARFGRKSLKLETPGSNNNEGVYYRADTTGINGVVSGSAYVRGNGKVRLRLIDGATGNQYVSQDHQLHDRYWQRLEQQGIAVGGDDFRLYVETVGTAPQEVTFYLDGAQVEEGIPTSYCDGDQVGCRWNGVFHASISEREDTSMAGGEWVPWRDDECDPDSYFTEVSGFGMPPITINRQQMALTAGSFYDSTRVDERALIINSFFRDSAAQKRKGTEIKKLFELRQRIEDLVKPDNNPSQDPFWLRFGQDGKWLYIRAHYESGMEFEFDRRNKWTTASSIRFLALDPYYVEDSQGVAT
jgi:hypothetical protein